MTTKDATSSKKGRGPRDYGTKPTTTVTAPVGFTEATTNDIFSFNKFGDKIAGKYIGLEKVGTGKKQFKVLKIQEKTGVVTRCSASAHILKQFELNNIKVNTEVMIVFVDLVHLSNQRTMKVFKVYFKK